MNLPQACLVWPGSRVQLWLEKIGVIEPFTGNLATCWSNIKEEEGGLGKIQVDYGKHRLVSFPIFRCLIRVTRDHLITLSMICHLELEECWRSKIDEDVDRALDLDPSRKKVLDFVESRMVNKQESWP
ncbi:hypothetical protein RND81_14G167500 [Saponaria officinalis]|uniref:Uncharacterized protein n=1 Tax=Saponaria officinalis TaxID=3572 RepID=A0AAW1GYQ5_SAPOF